MNKEIILKNDMSEVSRLAAFVEEFGAVLGLSPELVMNINLALEEAVANVIMYAYPLERGQDIRLKAIYSGEQLVFLLTDKGVSFDPTQVEEPDINVPVEERPVGGLGIFLIRQIMNEVSYERLGDMNQLTMKKSL